MVLIYYLCSRYNILHTCFRAIITKQLEVNIFIKRTLVSNVTSLASRPLVHSRVYLVHAISIDPNLKQYICVQFYRAYSTKTRIEDNSRRSHKWGGGGGSQVIGPPTVCSVHEHDLNRHTVSILVSATFYISPDHRAL